MRILHKNLEGFVEKLFIKAGVNASESSIIARILVWTDLIGRYTHGVKRVPVLLKRFQKGLIQSPCNEQVEQKSSTVYSIDGKGGFGPFLGHIAMKKAIDVAEEQGVGLVTVRDSNFYGAGAYYVNLAAAQLKIGIALSNAFPKVVAHGGVKAVFGTNPISFSAPMENKKTVLVDFSTSIVAGATIREYVEENKELPEGIAIDSDGYPIINPRKVNSGALLPFGEAKGYGLALIVEILAGVLTGAGISHEIASMFHDFENKGNIGHFFLTIDIKKFFSMDFYYKRMNQLVDIIKSSGNNSKFAEILIPGEKRWQFCDDQLKNGIQLDAQTISSLEKLAADFSLDIPWKAR